MLGAFRATPIRQLETEAFIPPLDLWLNGRHATFQARLEKTGMAELIRNACTEIHMRTQTLRRRPRRRLENPTHGADRQQWTTDWVGRPIDAWDERAKKLVTRDWEARWDTTNKAANTRN